MWQNKAMPSSGLQISLRRSLDDDLVKFFVCQNLVAGRTPEAATGLHQPGLDAEVAEVVPTSGARRQHRRTPTHFAVAGKVRRRRFGSRSLETAASLGQQAGCKKVHQVKFLPQQHLAESAESCHAVCGLGFESR